MVLEQSSSCRSLGRDGNFPSSIEVVASGQPEVIDVSRNHENCESELLEEEENQDSTNQGQKGGIDRRKKGSGLAGRIISALMMSANALAGAAHQTWTQTVRHNRLDFAEICCTADSQLSGEVISRGGTADRYSHWNGFYLTTRKGADALRDGLDATRPRWVWFSPACGPDSPMQNLNQKTEAQRENLA